MNKQLDRLLKISEKEEKYIIGLMSGTSLDGLDIALCRIKGQGRDTELHVDRFYTWEYPEELKERISSVASKEMVNQKELTILHSLLGDIVSQQILEALEKWQVAAENIDLIASHGQTVFHSPLSYNTDRSATFQIIDADHIAHQTGIITISDFRQKHTARGGQGAPLSAIFDEYLFRHDAENRVLLNLGGIGNFTYLPSLASDKEGISTDTGPANTLINEAMLRYFNLPYDKGGKIAAEGIVNQELLKVMKEHEFFQRSLPKTTGPEDFNLGKVLEGAEIEEIYSKLTSLIVTLTQLSIDSIAGTIELVTQGESIHIYVSGGGMHNKTMMLGLREKLPNAEVHPLEKIGIEGDAKEAAMMAFFANELIMGSDYELGKISLP